MAAFVVAMIGTVTYDGAKSSAFWADSIVAPMSLAIGWGLAISTIVTLFLVPCLYTVANDLRAIPVRERLRGLIPQSGGRAAPTGPTAEA